MSSALLTGFEPFADAPVNPSWEAVRLVADQWDSEDSLCIARLPVEFGTASAILLNLIATHQPDVVIATGVAEGCVAVSVERIAVNLRDARIPDNSGLQPHGTPVIDRGRQSLPSTLPVDTIVPAIESFGLLAEFSQSAGEYVCNDVFYALQHSGLAPVSGFIHVPASAQMRLGATVPTMSSRDVARALKIALEVSLASLPLEKRGV